jgi:hypothetical protein
MPLHDPDANPSPAATDPPTWGFLSDHGRVLLCLARRPYVLISEVAGELGLSELWTQQIVRELAASGHVTRQRRGRRNCYMVRVQAPLGHPVERRWRVEDLLALFAGRADVR